MFSSHEKLAKKTPFNGIGRSKYIKCLVDEFYTTTNVEVQEQVTANLANFAYDPMNFEALREAYAVKLFVKLLALPNSTLVLHGSAGLSNICLDPISRVEITKPENFALIVEVFQKNENTEVVINLLVLFMFLLLEDEEVKHRICSAQNLQRIHNFKSSSEARIKTLAAVFFKDFGTRTVHIGNAEETL